MKSGKLNICSLSKINSQSEIQPKEVVILPFETPWLLS